MLQPTWYLQTLLENTLRATLFFLDPARPLSRITYKVKCVRRALYLYLWPKLTLINFIINTLPGLPITWLLGLGRLTPTRMSKHLASEEQTCLIQWTLLGYAIYGQPYSANHKIANLTRISLKLTYLKYHTRLSPKPYPKSKVYPNFNT